MTREAEDIIRQMPALRRFALALTRDPSEAEDLVQDALLRGYEKRGGFRPGGNMKSWLFSILKNVFLDRRRNRLAREGREADAAALTPSAIDAPQESIIRLGQLRTAFFSLPDEQREALSLIAVEGLSYAEAARVADVPLGTLMSRVARARTALRAFEEGETGTQGFRIVGGRDAVKR